MDCPLVSTEKKIGSNRLDSLILGAAVVLGLAGAGLVSRATAERAPLRTLHPAPRSVDIRRLEPEAYRERVVLDGILEPEEHVSLAFEVPGRLLDVQARDGGHFEAGQVVARLVPEAYQAALDLAEARLAAAQARLDEAQRGPRAEVLRSLDQQVRAARADRELAETELGRARRLASRQATTRAELDRAVSRLDAARARERGARARQDEAIEGTRKEQIQLARAQRDEAVAARRKAARDLAETELRAPFAGTIQGRALAPGSVVDAGTGVAALVADQVLEARAGVPEKYLERYRPGAQVLVVVGEHRRPAVVVSLAPAVDRHTRTFDARVRLDNEDGSLRVGQSVLVVHVADPRPALILPPRAVLPSAGGELTVFAASGSGEVLEARRRPITGHWLKDGRIEVRAGLTPGDRVVVEGAAWLLDGDPVRARTQVARRTDS
jgi:HlyD family secretion protein